MKQIKMEQMERRRTKSLLLDLPSDLAPLSIGLLADLSLFHSLLLQIVATSR